MELDSTLAARRRVVLSGAIGNVMEWYDFAVYGFLASIIGSRFFPTDDPANSIIAAFGAFAAGFLARPLGGLLFGPLGDLVGRSHAMIASVLAMAVPTVLMGLLPTYDSIGIWAPVALVALRIIQGLSVGGEFTTSVVFLVENAHPDRPARTAIWTFLGGGGGILLGSAAGAICANFLTEAQLHSFGWRIPFLCGALVAFVGYLVRRSLQVETATGETKRPVRDTFGRHRWIVFRVILLNLGLAVSYYTALVYAVTYIRKIDQLPERTALDLNTGTIAIVLLIYPVSAWLSDRYGRKPVIVAGLSILAFGAIPLFHLMHSGDPLTIALGELGFALGLGFLNGGLVATFAELIPNAVRCTGIGVGYNTAMAAFGGTTPMIAAWLVTATGNPIAPAYWVAAACGVSLLTAVFLVPETRHKSLSQ